MSVVRAKGATRLALAALVCAGLSGACASTGGVPRPFPVPAGTSARRAPKPVPVPSAPAPGSNPVDADATPPKLDVGESVDRPLLPGRQITIDAYALAGTALSLRGTPYRNGGSDPSGFDCSGFTQYVFAQYGVMLPRDVRAQFRVGTSVKPDELAAGDIVFFTTTEPGPSHVAIAIGGDQFVHAPSSSGVVRVEHLSSSYWSPRYLGARRIAN
jgi:cell wall-associated NlpC family hydrolase